MIADGITTRERLFHYLTVACELEQGLCLQYLFTAFTLKDSLENPSHARH